MEFYKAYIKPVEDGKPVIETISSYGIYLKSMPFKKVECKDIPSNDWYDEDGEDEYVPAVQKIKAYEIETEWAYKGKEANVKINAFVNYLRNAGLMKIYDEFTKVGRNNVRFVSLNDDAELVRNDDEDILIFKITFKVNDPVTEITLG